jgi:hypothetical protein
LCASSLAENDMQGMGGLQWFHEKKRESSGPITIGGGIWILANCDITVLPDITAPDIGVSRISQSQDSDIRVTDLRYHITLTLMSQYQNSNIDCDIRGAVISGFKTCDITAPHLQYHR